jgi:PAS domain S-box-containing protein
MCADRSLNPIAAFPPALTELLDDTLRQVVDLLHADGGAVFVADEQAGELLLASSSGLSAAFVQSEEHLPFGTCYCGRAIDATRDLFIVEDVAHEPDCRIGNCLQDGFQSLLCLPLRAGGRVWGLLRLHSQRLSAFDRDEVQLLAFISSQLGLAIQRTRLQEEIAEERATLASLMRSLVDGLVLCDEQDRVTYCNPSAGRYLGMAAASLNGEPLLAVVTRLLAMPEQEPALAALHQALLHVHEYPQVELHLHAPGPRVLQARFFPLQGHKGYGLVLRDVTAERHLEEAKSQLLATVSHELRTPLASIKGFATTLLRDDVQWDAATQREFLQIIDQDADRLGELIANLLEMSRIEAGMLRIDYDWVDLPPLLNDAVNEMRLRSSQHTLVVEEPGGLPRVYADVRRIRQVLHNLLENAIKYSIAGDIRVRARTEPGQVIVSVSDQGPGIAPDQLQRVFERFHQLGGAATRKAGGAGLGLSICKGLIEAHGGRVWAESTPGAGSTFFFSLPVG